MTTDLKQKHCEACEGIGDSLKEEQINNLITQLDKNWNVRDNKKLFRAFAFSNFYETMAFVNAVAWIANVENHHPDVELGYNYCNLVYTTHALGGLSMNDFICAAKVDALL